MVPQPKSILEDVQYSIDRPSIPITYSHVEPHGSTTMMPFNRHHEKI